MVLQLGERNVCIAFGEGRIEVVRGVHVAAPWHLQPYVLLIVPEILYVLPLDLCTQVVYRIYIDAVASPKAKILRCGKEAFDDPNPLRTSLGEERNDLGDS